MDNNFVLYSEDEMSIAINRINAYVEFLSESITSYMRILSQSQEAIKDNLICAKLTVLSNSIDNFRKELSDLCDDLRNIEKSVESELSEADRFKYPDEWLAGISAMLARFL